MKNSEKLRKPPRVATWLFRQLLPDAGVNTLGDLEEVYAYMLEEKGHFAANRWYWGQLFLSFPILFRHTLSWSLFMIKNYLKIGFRNMRKHRMASLINLAGLAITIGCVIVCYLFIELRYTMDNFHENGDAIYMVENVTRLSGKEEVWGNTPLPLGPAAVENITGIASMARINSGRCAMRYGDKIFNEGIRYVDPDFFSIFSFPLKSGNPNALAAPNSLIIDEKTAQKYFASTDPVGKQVSLTFENDRVETFVIGAVAENVRINSSFQFSILLPFSAQKDIDLLEADWAGFTAATFLHIPNPAQVANVEQQMQRYIANQNSADHERPMAAFLLDPLLEIPQKAFHVRKSILAKIMPGSGVFFGLLTLLILSLSCFNYINIALASASQRGKEIGIRKVVGGSKFQLIVQFLGEHLLLCTIALTLGILLAQFLLIPGLNTMLGVSELFQLNFSGNLNLWLFFTFILLLTGVGAGAYPAFFIAGFEPVKIFRGAQTVRGKKRFTRILLAAQLTISFVLIVFGIVSKENTDYQRSRDWGYTQSQTLVVPFTDPVQFTAYKNDVSQHNAIKKFAGAAHHIGRGSNNAVINIGEKKHTVSEFAVGYGYIETMKLRLLAGKSFDENIHVESNDGIIVNESFLAEMGWTADESLGREVRLENRSRTISGVVKDFHFDDFIFEIKPILLRPAAESEYRYLAVDIDGGEITSTADFLETTWRERFPHLPYLGFFQDRVFDGYIRGMENGSKMFTFLSGVALLISCMGLFGLVALSLARRMKEISIRKVLGASLVNVIGLVNKEFMTILLIAVAIGSIVGYLVISTLFDNLFIYHNSLSFGPFIKTALLVLSVAGLTIISEVYRSATSNPVDVLRNE